MVDVQEILHTNFNVDGDVTINSHGVVDVKGYVSLEKNMAHLPVQFGTVTGHFSCSYSKLTSLVGSPHHVGGEFICTHNPLTSLKGGPSYVGGAYSCQGTSITNLVGAPRHVGNDFTCTHTPIINLMGAPDHVEGDFICNGNTQLTSLEGAPSKVDGSFLLTYNPELPLLRLLNYKFVHLYAASPQLRHIMEKYAGEGKPGAIKAAAELIKAGYKGNARW